MILLGWWNKKEMDKTVALQPNKDEKGICPECGGQGYSFNDDHCFEDCDDYERSYFYCRRCNGTGYYHSY